MTGTGDFGLRHEIIIRQATGNDLDAVVDVGRRTWPATYASIYEEELVDLFLEKKWSKQALIPSIRTGRTLVAEVAGRIVGVASYGPHEDGWALWKLYVVPEAQRRGVGGRLLGEVVREAAAVGRHVHISFTDGNGSAQAFTRAHGFTLMRREPQGEMPDLIWMSRPMPDDMPDAASNEGPGVPDDVADHGRDDIPAVLPDTPHDHRPDGR